MKKSKPPNRPFKRFFGNILFSSCNGVPLAKPLLRRWGLRTSEDWFANQTGRVQFANGRELRLCSLENYLSFELFWRGGDYYEPITRFLAEKLSDEAHLFIDAGANIGFYSLVLAQRRPQLQVISFDPNPRVNALLSRNVAANRLPNVRCESIALSDRTGTGRFFLDDSDMSASLELGFSGAPAAVVEVATFRLDDYVKKQTVEGRMLLKVDVEGHETAFFNGARETIRRHKPDIITEVTTCYDGEIERLLRAITSIQSPIAGRSRRSTSSR